MLKLTPLIFSLFLVGQAHGFYGQGSISRPLKERSNVISAGFNGIVSDQGGLGIDARYRHQLNRKATLDAGMGMSGGDRSSRFYIGGDFEIFPDHGGQPRISLRPTLVRSNEFENSFTMLSVAPTVSKGFSFWGKEAYPYLALPLGISLNSDSQSYETQYAFSAGIAGHLPIEDMKKWMAHFETTIELKDSFTAVFLGMSYPFE